MVPRQMLVDSFIYEEFQGKGRDHNPKYADPVTIEMARIDRQKTYGENSQEAAIRSNATIYTFAPLTTPFLDFKEQSRVRFDGREYVVVEVRKLKHWYLNEVMAYELDVM